MRVSTDILAELDGLAIDGNHVRITGQLDYAFYKKVDKVLQAAGGKWNRKAKAHVFDTDPAEVLEQVILTGEISTPQDMGYFPTPPAVVAELFDNAGLESGMTVLEPSAGTGAIALAVAGRACPVDCVEIDEKRAKAIQDAGYARSVVVGDFLAVEPEPRYDRVVMNPPFAKNADIAHVRHALQFLKPGGRLVSVMSNGVKFRQTKTHEDFRGLVFALGGRIEPLPDDAFKPSGTGVRTVIAVIPS